MQLPLLFLKNSGHMVQAKMFGLEAKGLWPGRSKARELTLALCPHRKKHPHSHLLSICYVPALGRDALSALAHLISQGPCEQGARAQRGDITYPRLLSFQVGNWGLNPSLPGSKIPARIWAYLRFFSENLLANKSFPRGLAELTPTSPGSPPDCSCLCTS